jgi:MFS family permease
MYQAMQNILFGFGAVLGASLGGVLADSIGWRFCYSLQAPVSILALAVGYRVLDDPVIVNDKPGLASVLERIDVSGASILVIGLVAQLLGISMGTNDFTWFSFPVIGSLVASLMLLPVFVFVEAKTEAIPIIPLSMLRGWQPTAVQLTNIFVGMASYAVSVVPDGVTADRLSAAD